jgi:U4/U6.U5 tri-snRNP-associated protein 1
MLQVEREAKVQVKKEPHDQAVAMDIDGDVKIKMEEEDDDEEMEMLKVKEESRIVEEEPLAAQGLAATLALLQRKGQLNQGEQSSGRAKDERVDTGRFTGVRIEHRDDFGNLLTQKEAFRQLSYKFHGMAPSTKKKEKLIRKMAEKQAAEIAANEGGSGKVQR